VLGIRVGLMALAVTALVTYLASRAAAGQCGAVQLGTVRAAADPVCDQLVRTLSTRVGLAAGVATVVILLTMAGLARLTREPAPQGSASAPR